MTKKRQSKRKPVQPGSGNDVIIIGGGLAGLFTALKLAPMPVMVISPENLGNSASSAWAQGGIAAALGEGDTPEKHAEDTIRAGDGLVDKAITHLLVNEASDRVDDLLRYGVPFDKDLEGKLKLSKEAAHGERRIARVKGDTAGKAIMAALISTVRNTPSIKVLEGFTATKLGTVNGRINGIYYSRTEDIYGQNRNFLHAQHVVLATGGIGAVYSVTTNPPTARGEGLAMALNVGAVIADAEFVQFHPTAINAGADPAPLATEALRGEGATLINSRGVRFMTQLHDDAELAPRDIVARAVHRELMSGRGAFLDCRTAIGNRFEKEFPTVFDKCHALGIDPVNELIPIAPAAHYHMGGILTDANGRSSVDGLWACGETASTGAHGANRLASNSLLEAVVFAARIATDIRGLIPQANRSNNGDQTENINTDPDQILSEQAMIQKLRKLMFEHVGVLRDHDGLLYTLKKIEKMQKKAGHIRSLKNMLLTAKAITVASLQRKESRGAHFRSDFPKTSKQFEKRSYLTKKRMNQIAKEQHLKIPQTENIGVSAISP